MKTKACIKRKNRGSILVFAFLITMVAALAAILMAKTLIDHQHANRRRRDLKRAYYAAEAGVAQVLHWGNHPEDYDNLDENGLFYRDMDTGDFPNLDQALNEQGEYVIAGELLATFADKFDFDVSNINQIVLIPADPDNDPITCLFKIRAEGLTPSGASRRVLAYVEANPIDTTEVKLMAGLISMATAAQAGNGHVHWGESWSKQNFNILGKPHLDDELDPSRSTYDPFAKYRSEAQLIFDPTWKSGEGKDIYEEDIRRWPAAPPASGTWEATFEQFIPPGVLQWPDFKSKYQVFKDHAMAHGRYYTTDASGNIYKGEIKDEAHKVNFDYEFHVEDRDTAPYDLVFIDTIDGNPPAEDESNLAWIKNAGTGGGMKGVFYIAAHYDQVGQGTRPNVNTSQKPILNEDGSVSLVDHPLNDILLDGVMYIGGYADFGGNPRIYGSLIAELGYVGGGTPEIYFNHKLIEGLEIDKGNIGSVFYIPLQQNF